MERIKLEELLLAAAEWLAEPQNEDKLKKFEDMKNNLVVKEYLPLEAKKIIIERILYDAMIFPENILCFASEFEIITTFDAILAYTNIDLNFDVDLRDEKYYDILWASGICDYILNFCKSDYDRILRMAWQMLDYKNLKNLVESVNRISPKEIEKLNNSLENIKINLNENVIKNISTIAAMNDPLLNDIKSTIEETALKTAIKEEEE